MNAKKIKDTAARIPIVINTTRGPKIIPFGGISDGGVGVIDMERMKFWAGLNAPKDAKDFENVSQFDSYSRWVKDGTFQEIDDVSEIPTIGNADEVIIEASASRTSMEWWLVQEVRPAVRKKLEAKIKEMKRRRTPGDED